MGQHLDLEGLAFLIIISQNVVHNQAALGVIGSQRCFVNVLCLLSSISLFFFLLKKTNACWSGMEAHACNPSMSKVKL